MGLFLLSESKDVHEVEYHPNVDEVEVEAQLRTQRLSQYKELTFAFYTFNSNYWISWECAELLIRLSSSGVSFRLCVTFTFLFRYRSDSRSFHAFARTLFHTRYPHHSYLLRLFPYHMISMWYSLFRSSIPLSEYNYILPVFMPFSCVPSWTPSSHHDRLSPHSASTVLASCHHRYLNFLPGTPNARPTREQVWSASTKSLPPSHRPSFTSIFCNIGG